MSEICEYGAPCACHSLVLGGFESLHKGHAALIGRAKQEGGRVAVMLAEYPDLAGKRRVILNFEERAERASALGADVIWRVKFSRELLATTPREFYNAIEKTMAPSLFVCGEDFRFGHGREGDAALLNYLSGGRTVVVDKVKIGGEVISTTEIKRRMDRGDMAGAYDMLGYYPFSVGEVVRGRGVGATIGFATANFKYESSRYPLPDGVYACWVTVNGKRYKGVTNLGGAPTFGVSQCSVETHILGYSGNIYGERIKVEFVKYLRPVTKFESAEELIGQINKDKNYTEKYL